MPGKMPTLRPADKDKGKRRAREESVEVIEVEDSDDEWAAFRGL